MSVGKSSPKQVVVAVRHVLVRRWIEVSRLEIQYYRGLLRLQGTIRLIGGITRSINPSFLENVECDLRKISGVKQLNWELSNWSKVDGSWISR